MRLSGGELSNASYLLLAAYALLGLSHLIRSLALLWFISFIGPDIAPVTTASTMLRYTPIAGAALSCVYHGRFSLIRVSPPVYATLCLGGFILIHSIIFSSIADVSVLKLSSWLCVTIVLLTAWRCLDYDERLTLERQLFGGLSLLTLACTPLVFTDIGYARNGYAFQGILDSSQSWGLVMAILASWLAGSVLENKPFPWTKILLLCLCLILLVLSGTRTAGLSILLSSVCTSIIYFGLRVPILTFIRNLLLWFLVITLAWFAFSSQLNTFIFKRDNVDSVLEIGNASRGVLVNPMIENIYLHPLQGIGFGVPSEPSKTQIQRESFFGLPIAAPIEKGVTPIAVLEELGLFGFIGASLWAWLLIRSAYRSGYTAFLVVSTIFFTNLGEASLFSVGGMGLLNLIFLCWAVGGQSPYAKIHYLNMNSVVKSPTLVNN
jgi:O-Antigen ligase